MKKNRLFCIDYVTPLWLLLINRISLGASFLVLIILLVFLVEKIAIKEPVFDKKNKILAFVLLLFLLVTFATFIYIAFSTPKSCG